MKKLKRNAEKFDVLELFSEMAVAHGYDLNDPLAQDDFINRVKRSIESSKESRITIYGKRTESLFAYVVGALGKTKLLKQEDSGDIYFAGREVLAPDYRLTLEGDNQILVEVKNCHFKSPGDHYSIKKEYYLKLKRYAELNGIELKFAIYFSSWKLWTLLSIGSFYENKRSYTINLLKAMAASEMATLGDCMIATTPDLELHLLANPAEAGQIDKFGKAPFTVRDVKIFCAESEVVDGLEKEIAFYLIRYGDWIEKEAEAIIEGGRLRGVKLTYTPEEESGQNFNVVGHLSTMANNGFREHTVRDGDVIALKVGLDPVVFKALIPEGYKGKNLPLWSFIVEPNKDIEP